MSLSSENNRVNATGNGNTSSYSYTFKIYEDADLLVTVRNTSGVESTLALTTDYTVTGAGNDAGGSISLVNSGQSWLTAGGKLISGYAIAIRRVLELKQETDIRNQGDFFPEVHEDEFDRLVMQDQQQQDAIDRSLKMPETLDPADFDATIPATIVGQGNRVIGTNEDGDGIEVGPTYDEISGAQASATAAATSATASATSATASATSATTSAASATAAATSATNAATSATAAATSATGAATSATAAAASAGAAASSETQAANSVIITSTDALQTTADKNAAAASATAAAGSATAAAGSATTASTQASNAATSATNAANSATAAASSATAAAASAAASTGLANYANDAAFVSANGAAQTGDAYFNTTLGKVRVYSGSAWVEVGSGSGGATNFITNYNAETDTTGFATYNDGAAAIVDGTGGTASGITFTRSTTSPLIGTASFLLSRTGAALGQGVSYDFTIDSAYQAKVLQIDFEYRAISGTLAAGSSTTDSDILIYIIDRTNGTVIQPSTYKLFASSSTLSTTFTSNFQTASNSTAYRICFHIPNSTATAFGLQIDSLSISPSNYVYGTPITDWQRYTPTLTGVTLGNGYTNFFYRRVGDSIQIKGNFRFGTTSSLSGTFKFSLPSGMTLNTSKLPVVQDEATGYARLGVGAFYDAGIRSVLAILQDANSTSAFYFAGKDGTTAIDPASSTNYTMGTSDDIEVIEFTAPIAGWSSSSQVSDQAESRVISGTYTMNTAYAVGANAIIKFDTIVDESVAMYSASTGLVTIPVSGRYRISIVAKPSAGSGYGGYISKNGVNVGYIVAPSAIADLRGGSTILNLRAGDTIGMFSNIAVTIEGAASSQYVNWFTVERLSQASIMSATETISCSYGSTNSPSVTSTYAKLTFNTKSWDSHSAYSSGNFVAPCAGKFEVRAQASFTQATYTTSQLVELQVYKNGAEYKNLGRTYGNGTSQIYMVGGSALVDCNAGDTISIYAGSTVSNTILASAVHTFMEVKRIGM